MLLVGLTGNVASGKSAVARMFADRGATVIDADVLSRRAVEPGTPALAAIVAHWGPEILRPDGTLDRGALRRRVFRDAGELETLNAIVHPEVMRLRQRLLTEARARLDRMVICDIPLLFEKHLEGEFDRLVLVDAPRTLRLERLVRDRGLPMTEAQDMIAAQMPSEAKRPRSHYCIDNVGTLAELETRVADVWRALAHDAAHAAATPARFLDTPVRRP
jgi:dephospho-CoA kinase